MHCDASLFRNRVLILSLANRGEKNVAVTYDGDAVPTEHLQDAQPRYVLLGSRLDDPIKGRASFSVTEYRRNCPIRHL